jgi:hypothetical protein
MNSLALVVGTAVLLSWGMGQSWGVEFERAKECFGYLIGLSDNPIALAHNVITAFFFSVVNRYFEIIFSIPIYII